MPTDDASRQGAWPEGDAVRFRWWAPERRRLELVLCDGAGEPTTRAVALERGADGCFTGALAAAPDRLLYRVRIDGAGPFPDPFSRSQPFGVHGASELLRPGPRWTDAPWRGVPLAQLVVSEVHVGTATPEGTFDALAGRLSHFASLGVTALELMPVASFPGRRNWGYDGVDLFAPAAAYGGPAGLARLVDAAHAAGLAVLLDVVYNHLGPDGNYLAQLSPRYFTRDLQTPWGDALDTRVPQVRELLCANARMWVRDYHLDGLRLDATDTMLDRGTPSILREIAEAARGAAPGRQVLVVAEDARNEARLAQAGPDGGGLDALWADDLHHQLRRAFAGDHEGYFADFTGSTADLAKTLEAGWFYRGQPTRRTGTPRGTAPEALALPQFVWCLQNHDQVGNRAFGDRLGASVSPAAHRAMAALLLLGPATPLLFQGQEWDASTPFLYFTDHAEPLGRAVTEGRRREFRPFAAFAREVPDPQDEATFRRSRLDWGEPTRPAPAAMLAWYRALLALRRTDPALRSRERATLSARAVGPDSLVVDRRGEGRRLRLFANVRGAHRFELEPGWGVLLSSADPRFGGEGEVVVAGRTASFDGPGALVVARADGGGEGR